MYLGRRICAAYAPLDRSAVPIQQLQHCVLVPLSGCGMPGCHLDNGDEEQLSRWTLRARHRHRPKYSTEEARIREQAPRIVIGYLSDVSPLDH